MPALDLLRALIHPGKSRRTPGKKLQKQSTLRSKKKPAESVASVDAGHGHRDLPSSPRPPQTYPRDQEFHTDIHRNASRHAPSLHGQGPYYAPTPIYPQETQYFEYDDYVTGPLSPVATSIQYPSGRTGSAPNESWLQPSTYEAPGPSPLDYKPNFIIEPSEPEDWSPIPDVHRQSSGSQDEFQSMHGTFGLGDRSSRKNADSMVSDARWTNRAEYDQSAVYEFYEEDPDPSRPVSSSYRPQSPPTGGHHPAAFHPSQHTPRNAGSSRPSHEPFQYDIVAPTPLTGSTRSALSTKYKDAPILTIPQPPHAQPQHPPHPRDSAPSRSSSARRNSKAVDPRERAGSPLRPAHSDDRSTPLADNSRPSRENTRESKYDPSPTREKRKGREPHPRDDHQQNEELVQRKGTSKVAPKISPENIQPEIYERDYGSDDEVIQYIVPAGVDVIFRDPHGNEITRVGEFPNTPQPTNKQYRSAPMVVLDEHGNELYRSFGQLKRRRGFKYDGHIHHNERPMMQTPRSAGSHSSRASTKTFLIDEHGNQIPIAGSNGSRSSSSRPALQPSRHR